MKGVFLKDGVWRMLLKWMKTVYVEDVAEEDGA